jgi:hypothetical protein
MAILNPRSSILDWALFYSLTFVNTRRGFF